MNGPIYLGWGLLVFSLIGWPISALTIAKDEPQVVLGLSWFAIVLTAATFLFEAYIRKAQEEK